jgi:LuxR family maltose regulon positive regulatory protein
MAIRGVPRVPRGLRARPRLTERFDAANAIVIAQAPAGYGKSIAMAHWASETSADGVWIRVRDGDGGSAAFVQHLAAELAAVGLLQTAHPLVSASDALAGGADAWLLLRRGLQSLAPLTVAVDGLDRLGDDTLQGIGDLVRDLPQVNVRGTARRRGPLHEPALALGLDVSIIEAHELTLTPSEVADALGTAIDSPRVAEVVASGAVPLFLRLAGAGVSGGRGDERRSEAAVAATIDSLIAAELGSGSWDSRFTRFVEATSVADTLDVALATELAVAAGLIDATPDGGVEAADLLDRAEVEGLGLWTGPSRASAVFTYTPLMREGFERRLRAGHPQLVDRLVRAAAEWELAHAHPYPALRWAVELQDWDLASRVIRSYWNELMRNHSPQLRRLFHGTSLGVLRRQPLVTMLLALDYNRNGHHRLRALEYFALAAHAARTRRENTRPADRAVLRTIESAALRVSGRFDGALTAALDARDILHAMGPDERDGIGRAEPTLYNQVGTSLFYAGRTEDALEEFGRSTSVGASRGLKGGLHGLALSAGALAVAGDLREAHALIGEAALLDWPEGWLTGYMGSFLQLALAFESLEALDADGADARIRSLDAHRETIEHWPLLAHVDALVELLRQNPERARLRLDAEITRQRRRRATAPQTLARLAHTKALIELAAGRPAAAEKLLGRVPSSRRHIGAARIALARAQPGEALRHLLNAAPATGGGDIPSSRSLGESLALRAGALALLRDDERAPSALERAQEFFADRGQGLALALVPAEALEAMVEVARRSGLPAAELERACRHAVIRRVSPVPVLSPRELELARVLPQTQRTSEIAALLSVSPNTVKTQLRGLYRKLGVGNRSEAIAALSVMVLIEGPADARTPEDSDPFA